MKQIIKKIFGDKHSKDVKTLQPVVDEIKGFYEKVKDLSDEELKGKTVIGVLCDKDLPEYLDEYQKKIIDVARKR